MACVFSLTIFMILLISLFWEATLAVPYQWWGYQQEEMMGISIGAWAGLPIEAVLVWIAVAYGTTIVYEVMKVWQASGRSPSLPSLGCPEDPPNRGWRPAAYSRFPLPSATIQTCCVRVRKALPSCGIDCADLVLLFELRCSAISESFVPKSRTTRVRARRWSTMSTSTRSKSNSSKPAKFAEQSRVVLPGSEKAPAPTCSA